LAIEIHPKTRSVLKTNSALALILGSQKELTAGESHSPSFSQKALLLTALLSGPISSQFEHLLR
jgi:hypothetical protein